MAASTSRKLSVDKGIPALLYVNIIDAMSNCPDHNVISTGVSLSLWIPCLLPLLPGTCGYCVFARTLTTINGKLK